VKKKGIDKLKKSKRGLELKKKKGKLKRNLRKLEDRCNLRKLKRISKSLGNNNYTTSKLLKKIDLKLKESKRKSN